MRFLFLLSDFLIPLTVLVVVVYGCTKKVDLFEAFLEGAKMGLATVLDILPTLIGLMVAISVLRAGGTFEILTRILQPLANHIGFPVEIIPLSLMRLVSSSAATGLLMDLFHSFGPDSFIGRLASIMMSCTETIFYTMSVYFMSIKIRDTRYTLWCALFANFAGIVAAYYITVAMFA